MREFELGRYLRASKKPDLEGTNFEAVPRYPLTPEEIRVLTYMMERELSKLPGLDGMRLLRRAFGRAERRAGASAPRISRLPGRGVVRLVIPACLLPASWLQQGLGRC